MKKYFSYLSAVTICLFANAYVAGAQQKSDSILPVRALCIAARTCLISWPGHLPQNQTRHQVGVGTDWFPTLAELCGIPLPSQELDGKSLVPIITKGAASPHQSFHWLFDNQWWFAK